VVWSERDGSYQIKYAQITAGELAALETLTDTPDLSIRPSVIVDGEGIVHVAWMETDPVVLTSTTKDATEGSGVHLSG